jgi:hypothetical protein
MGIASLHPSYGLPLPLAREVYSSVARADLSRASASPACEAVKRNACWPLKVDRAARVTEEKQFVAANGSIP